MTNRDLIQGFRSIITQGKCVYGPFMKTEDPMFVEIAGLSGFDYVILDMEHGPTSLQQQQNNIRAAVARDILPIIRVNGLNENSIGAALDIGACGIQVPQVTNAVQAKKVVEFSKFYPHGMRGVCRFVRAADYANKERSEYFAESKNLVIVIQLEGKEAIGNLDEILAVEGIDIVFIGPYDLSQSLGVPGEIDNPVVINKVEEIAAKTKEKGKVVGTFVDTIANTIKWRNAGIQYLSYNTDAGIFTEACCNYLNSIKQ